MKLPLVKTFFGQIINLDKVVAISEARFIDHGMGNMNLFERRYCVGFEIRLQHVTYPLYYERPFAPDETARHEGSRSLRLKKIDGTDCLARDCADNPEAHKELLAIQRLQKQIDVIVGQWEVLVCR